MTSRGKGSWGEGNHQLGARRKCYCQQPSQHLCQRDFPGGSVVKNLLYLVDFPGGAAAAKSLQSCPTLCDPIDGSPAGSPVPWDSPGKNTGVGCHCLLQCMKVKSESEGAQSCLTLIGPMDCSLPGSSVRGIFQARVLESGAIAFSVYIMQEYLYITYR